MKLLEHCMPLFEDVCRLNRLVRAGMVPEPATVRAEFLARLEQLRSDATREPGLGGQYERVELPLIFFVDGVIRESRTPLAEAWSDLAAERDETTGDEKFFDQLDEALADGSEEATERLEVFYTCLGLGFTGWYAGQPDYLRKKMDECRARLGARMESPESSRVCPEAYEHVDTSDLVEPPARSLVGITIALVGLIVVLVAANVLIYNRGGAGLRDLLEQITVHTDGASAEAGG